MILELVIAALILIGSAFMVVAALGIVRLPDILTRMHAATKAGTLGATLLLVGVALTYRTASALTHCAAVIVFLCLTAPVAAHVVGHAAYFWAGARLWKGTRMLEVPRDPRETTR
jgi:multicomponent Na+:H+ antiporter subunit G